MIALALARGLLPGTSATVAATPAEQAPAARRRGTRRADLDLAALALTTMLCEGAANDWSTLHLKDVLGAPASTAAFGYGTFAAA